MVDLVLRDSLRCSYLQASLIAERSFREVGAVLVQLEESQVARQASEAEKHRLAQQVETLKGEVAEKTNQARLEAEREAEAKYLAKYQAYRASAESDFKRQSDDLRASNSKLQEELSEAKLELEAQTARLHAKNELFLKRNNEYNALEEKLHEEQQHHTRSKDLVAMLELGLAEKDAEIASQKLRAQEHVADKQTVLEQNRLQRKEINSLQAERDASKAELEKLKAQAVAAEEKLVASEAKRLREKDEADVVLNRTINLSYVVLMHQLWKANPEVLSYLGDEAAAMEEKVKVWDQGSDVYFQKYDVDEPAEVPAAGDSQGAGTSEPTCGEGLSSNEPAVPVPVETIVSGVCEVKDTTTAAISPNSPALEGATVSEGPDATAAAASST